MKTTNAVQIGLVSLFASAAPLLAQFQPLSESDYADLIAERNWGGELAWNPVDSSFDMATGPFAVMNVGFISGTSGSWTSFGAQKGDPVAFDSAAGPGAWSGNQTLFTAAGDPAGGSFVSIPLNGEQSFDFWLNLEPASRDNPYYCVWSLLNPESSTDHLVASGFEEVIDDEIYYVFSFQDGTKRSSSESLRFFVHFQGDASLTAVPEPSFYGAVGALLLVGLILRRRFRR